MRKAKPFKEEVLNMPSNTGYKRYSKSAWANEAVPAVIWRFLLTILFFIRKREAFQPTWLVGALKSTKYEKIVVINEVFGK